MEAEEGTRAATLVVAPSIGLPAGGNYRQAAESDWRFSESSEPPPPETAVFPWRVTQFRLINIMFRRPEGNMDPSPPPARGARFHFLPGVGEG